MFFRLVASVGQRKNSESPRGIEPQTCGFRKKTSLCISLPSSKLTFSRSSIYNLYAFDTADPSSMQDACHMNFEFVIDLAHRRVSVAQWLEHRSAESEGLSEGTQNFFFVPRSWQDENTSFSISLPSSKLTISRISIYISFYRCFESIQRKYIETSFNFPFPNENNNKFLILSCLSRS